MIHTRSISSASTHSPKSIFILSAPRTTSTLLMRIFGNTQNPLLPNAHPRTLLEPFTQVFYLQPGQSPAPEFNPQTRWPQTPQAAQTLVRQSKSEFSIIKDLAYQCEPFMDDAFIREILEYIEPLFLVRSPDSTIPSALNPYAKSNTLNDFGEEDIGYLALLRVFERFKENMTHKPLVIEAESYLKNPVSVLSAYFEKLNLHFEEDVLNLPATTPASRAQDPAYAAWGDTWYLNAYATTQVKPKTKKTGAAPYKHLTENPKTAAIMQAHMETQVPAYLKIKTQGTILGTDAATSMIQTLENTSEQCRVHGPSPKTENLIRT